MPHRSAMNRFTGLFCCFAGVLALTLAGCGGGGGGTGTGGAGNGNAGGTTIPTAINLSGVAASAGGAISGATVTVKDTSGKSATGTTISDGSFQVDVQGMTPPFLLSVTSNGQTSFGYASQSGSVANLNQYSTAVLQAYYLTKGSNLNQTFAGTLNSVNVPTQSQVDVLTKTVVRAIQPYLISANVIAPQNFNPMSALFTYSSSSGFGQVLSNTTISTTGVGFTVTSPTTSGPTTAFSYTSGASGVAAATPATDFVTIQSVTTTPGSPTTTLTAMKDLCSAHGTPLPGTTGVYDCTSKITISPNPINISAGAYVAMGDFLLTPSNLNPSVEIFDVNGIPTSIPPGQTYLKWNSSDSAAIQLSSPSTLYWPTLTALNVGTSLVTLTDTISNVSAQVTVNGIIPILTPSTVIVAPPLPYGSNAKRVKLTDSSGNKVATPAGLTVSTVDPKIATASFDSSGDILVQGVSPTGMTILNVQGTFGNAGVKNIAALVCASGWAPSQITITVPAAPISASYSTPPLTVPDSISFTGTLLPVNNGSSCPMSWYIDSGTFTSTQHPNYFSVPFYTPTTITLTGLPAVVAEASNFYGTVSPSMTIPATATTSSLVIPAHGDFIILKTGIASGAVGDEAGCTSISFSNGPMIGQTGTQSTGNGTWSEYVTDPTSLYGLGTQYGGVCTVTIQ